MAAAKVKLTVTATLQHVSGPFTNRDELAELLQAAIEGADEGSWFVDESEYETSDFEVDFA